MDSAGDLDAVPVEYHRAAERFSWPGAMIARSFRMSTMLYLANPFGPSVRGAEQVRERLAYASARMSDGAVEPFEWIARHASGDLACLFAVERWRARVGGEGEVTPFQLCVTTIFRHEPSGWKIIAPHADPIASADPTGPLRTR